MVPQRYLILNLARVFFLPMCPAQQSAWSLWMRSTLKWMGTNTRSGLSSSSVTLQDERQITPSLRTGLSPALRTHSGNDAPRTLSMYCLSAIASGHTRWASLIVSVSSARGSDFSGFSPVHSALPLSLSFPLGMSVPSWVSLVPSWVFSPPPPVKNGCVCP